MSTFGVTMLPAFGTSGEFTLPGSDDVSAKYLMTKISPGDAGNWWQQLASHMVPWREVFKPEQLDFDELLQRDLDDSRVAHDLIPYLLGEDGAAARFFPPILAVIVPKIPSTGQDSSGIENLYPEPTPTNPMEKDGVEYTDGLQWGSLFRVSSVKMGGSVSPLAHLEYNPSKVAFVIADGQHRAMAILALHRQINQSWENQPSETYYGHINVANVDLSSLELPVCLVYFPDLHAGNTALLEKQVDLRSVCRELFTVVNKSAKPVTQSRELLLDDKNYPARMMRRSLGQLKDRSSKESGVARIYSIAYGDAENDKSVVTGHGKELTSAVAVYRIHCALTFGRSDAFSLNSAEFVDVSDLRNARNPDRPVELLHGEPEARQESISRDHAMRHRRDTAQAIVEKLGTLSDSILLPLFDEFRPFAIHNKSLEAVKSKLESTAARGNATLSNVRTLLFQGSGAEDVFRNYQERLEEVREECGRAGQTVPGAIESQLSHCSAVTASLNENLTELRRTRACEFFKISYEALYETGDDSLAELAQELEETARDLYRTVSTQAFQLGFAMAVATVNESLYGDEETPTLTTRTQSARAITATVLEVLNQYFSPTNDTVRKSRRGYLTEGRAGVFSTSDSKRGLRQFLKQSTPELNEKCWRFFRYAVLEILLSKDYAESLASAFTKHLDSEQRERLGNAAQKIVEFVDEERQHYIEQAAEAYLKKAECSDERLKARAAAEAKGEPQDSVEEAERTVETKQRAAEIERCLSYIKESVGEQQSPSDVVGRLQTALATP